MRRLILISLMGLFVGACATPPTISNAPKQDVIAAAIAKPDSTIGIGLQNAAWNLDQAIAIGVLPSDDPADLCVHAALQRAGIETTPGAVAAKSFVPKVSDAISAGSVLYIQAKQAQGAAPGITISTGCKALLGDVVLQGLAATAGAASVVLPGGGTLMNIIKAR